MFQNKLTKLPKLPIPEVLRSNVPGSAEFDTMTQRVPDILRRTIADGDFSAETTSRLYNLLGEIPYGVIRPMRDQVAPDFDDWQTYVEPYVGMNWLDVPWFFAETYFYRRIIEATGFFLHDQDQYRDPFAREKQRGLDQNTGAIAEMAQQLTAGLDSAEWQSTLRDLLLVDLWGNQADMSMWAVNDADQPRHTESSVQRDHLLVDDSQAVVDLIASKWPTTRIDFIIDNVGFELTGDFALADYLLSRNLAREIHLHLKCHPTFVSDATVADVDATIRALCTATDEHVQRLGTRLDSHSERGRLRLQTHPFWTSPLPFWELPDTLRLELAQADLLICKGDANYRRLLGDGKWPFTTSFDAIVSYLPTPLVALRTHKSPVAAGLSTAQVAMLDQRDPTWRNNGKWGVIQLAEPGNSEISD
jgi:uncharacterized protein with ATP-grasp and redox domains